MCVLQTLGMAAAIVRAVLHGKTTPTLRLPPPPAAGGGGAPVRVDGSLLRQGMLSQVWPGRVCACVGGRRGRWRYFVTEALFHLGKE